MIGRGAWVLAVVLVACGCGPTASPAVTAAPPPATADQKLAWILQLEDQRIGRGSAPGQDMVLMLGDEQAHIRRRAALGAGRARLADAVEPLSAMLATEADPEVRQMAAFALGLIGNPDAAAALTTALATPDPLLQGRAAEALGAIGHKPGAAAIAAMMRTHLADGALASLAADDVGSPKSRQPRPCGWASMRSSGSAPTTIWRPRCSTRRASHAAGGGPWPMRSSGLAIRVRPLLSRGCCRERDSSRALLRRAVSAP